VVAKDSIKLIECPRDAMQGIHDFIPTEKKIRYINSLLKVGFDTLDFGSFVSPKAIPQLVDTQEVLENLDLKSSSTKLLAIVANERGGLEASKFKEISYLGFPFSISEIFQKRNTNSSINDSLKLVQKLLNICQDSQQELVVYVSMGFGNPYNEPWSVDIVLDFCEKLAGLGVNILSLSDTIGSSNPDSISQLFSNLIPAFPNVEFGAHLHTAPHNWREKIVAAYDNGCRRFDGAIKGFGGCPMAADELVGNMPMENLLTFAEEKKLVHHLNPLAFESSYNMALEVFPN
jgi:hydroxymethylglutaryl-CoA lyase|tara:strand:- start:129954 stop:130820 length:867 start_codon:yes stop_codon:yes gene_type:complete